jgi:[ribosomal protein S5]-alanine N-acetyltransferase
MIFPKFFETERLLLRQPEMEDALRIYDRYASDPKVTKYLNWLTHNSVKKTEVYLERMIEKNRDNRGQSYVIEPLDSSIGLVGMIAMHYPNNFEIKFGYVLMSEKWGQGIISEALIALVKWALAQDHICRLSAMCDAENRGSARVLEKAGFENEGLMRKSDICPNLSSVPRDHLLFSKVK